MKRCLLALLGAISLSACAQAPDAAKDASSSPAGASVAAAAKPVAGSADERAVAAIEALSPRAEVESVGPAALPGFREAIVAGQVVYVSDDGKYLFLPGGPGGGLFDTEERKNLSEDAMAKLRVELLKTIPASERIVFAPAKPVHTVTVFTDVECGFCRKLHSEIAQYNAEGIAVEYLAFPRMGIGSEDFDKMVSVWCASDRKKALTDAKMHNKVADKSCKNTVTMQYNIGQRAGLTGTPMILSADGVQLGGYIPPKALRATLDDMAADATGGARADAKAGA